MRYEIDRKIRRTRQDIKRWLSLRRNQRKLTLIIMGVVIASLFFGLVFSLDRSSEQNYTLVQRQHSLIKLNKALKSVQKQKATTQAELKQKADSEASLKAEVDDLTKQLQAKKASQLAEAQAAQAVTQAQPLAQPSLSYQSPITGGCQTYWSGDLYLDNIIRFESGGNSCATNPGGCFGLLQACPGEPLRLACGGDPGCQIAWFQQYKTGGRSWAQVWQHELAYGWW